jgi:hypothetical protein
LSACWTAMLTGNRWAPGSRTTVFLTVACSIVARFMEEMLLVQSKNANDDESPE